MAKDNYGAYGMNRWTSERILRKYYAGENIGEEDLDMAKKRMDSFSYDMQRIMYGEDLTKKFHNEGEFKNIKA